MIRWTGGSGKLKVKELTDTGTVEHQIPCLAVAQTPEDHHSAEHSGSSDDVADTRRPFCEHMVVSCCDPQMSVRNGRPPEGERISNPVGEEQPCSHMRSAVEWVGNKVNEIGQPTEFKWTYREGWR